MILTATSTKPQKLKQYEQVKGFYNKINTTIGLNESVNKYHKLSRYFGEIPLRNKRKHFYQIDKLSVQT